MINLNYKKYGIGDTHIIFLHELMGDCRNYNPIIPYLDTKTFSYYFVDLRGYGLSKDIKGNYTCEEASQDISDLITILELQKVTIVAHSMSTMIAQKIALIDIRVKKLILITPISAAGIKMKDEAKNKLLFKMNENKDEVERIVEASSKRYDNSWREYRIDMGYSSSTLKARVGYMNMYLSTDFLDEAKKIQIPIKIITGVYDFPVFAKANVSKLFKDYIDIEIISSNESGHYPMIETPPFFISHIHKWCKN